MSEETDNYTVGALWQLLKHEAFHPGWQMDGSLFCKWLETVGIDQEHNTIEITSEEYSLWLKVFEDFMKDKYSRYGNARIIAHEIMRRRDLHSAASQTHKQRVQLRHDKPTKENGKIDQKLNSRRQGFVRFLYRLVWLRIVGHV